MNVAEVPPASGAACMDCLRRSWLLAQLSGPLDCNCRADGRLFDLLELADEELIGALAGRRLGELENRHARFAQGELAGADGIEQICRHDPRYPPALRAAGLPTMVFVGGELQRLTRLTARPVVAIVGTSKATDYGIEMSGALARGLAASGVTVASELADGIARAAQEGAASVRGAALVVLASGADAAPDRRRPLLRRIASTGAVLSELPCGTPGRRWSSAAAIRIVTAIAEVTVVVEAADSRRELTSANIARALGKTVAAVPGRVTSHASCGPIALLRDGASLVRGPADVLDLLAGVGRPPDPCSAGEGLEPRLREVLERVGSGLDTPGRLTDGSGDPGAMLQALSELELLGLLARGHGGRYVPTHALGDPSVRYGSSRQMEP